MKNGSKDDPSNGILISGQKVKDIARKNMYLTLGAQMGFEESQVRLPCRMH
jgi:hypothetical protein